MSSGFSVVWVHWHEYFILLLTGFCSRDDPLFHTLPSGQSLLHVHRICPQQHRPHPSPSHHPGLCLRNFLHPFGYFRFLNTMGLGSSFWSECVKQDCLPQVFLWWSAWCCTSPTLMMKCWTEPRVTRPTSATSMAGPSPSPPSPSCWLR